MDEASQEVVLEPQEQAISPAGASLGTPLAGSQPLRRRGHSRLEATPAIMRAGTAAQSFARRIVHNRSDSAHLVTIATGRVLSKLRWLRLYTKETLPDIAYETYGADSTVEYAYAATIVQSCSAGENAEITSNTFKEAMTLPAKAQGKAASGKEMASLKNNYVYTLLPAASVPAGHKIIGSRWAYKVKADKSHKGRVVVLGWGQLPGIDCNSTFTPVCRLQSIRMMLAIAAEYILECWQLDYYTACLNADVTEEVYVKMPPGCKKFDENGVALVVRLLRPIQPPPEPD